MSKKTIYTVGIDLPGDEFEYIPFHSHSTLLDADLVIYAPTLDPEVDAARNRESLAFWKRELAEALSDGKQVIVFLTTPIEAPAGVAEQSSYAALPLTFRALRKVTEAAPTLTPAASFLAAYWQEFKAISRCCVEFELDHALPLLTRNSARSVGAILPFGKGQLLLLPSLEFDHDQFTLYDASRQEYFWTDAALAYGKRLLLQLNELDRALATPPPVQPAASTTTAAPAAPAGSIAPAWVADAAYRLPAEVRALASIAQSRGAVAELQQQIARLEREIAAQEAALPALRRAQELLYESGPALEKAVAEALLLCGLVAESPATPFLFRADGVRCLCAVAGHPTAAIELERVLRLEQALQEDFARDGVTEYARGILLVNPCAATPPSERKQLLSPKALAAAQRFGFALVPTVELFRAVQALEGKPDERYAAQVRAALLVARGELVVIPPSPH